MWLSQTAYIDEIIRRFGAGRPRTTPLPHGELWKGESNDLDNPTPYQTAVGMFQWLASCSRLDVSYAASFLAKQLLKPTEGGDAHFVQD